MKKEIFWVRVSILNLCTVAFVGMLLRSKILFPLSFIDYNRLLDAHGHFAFGAWATLALMFLLVFELFPESLYRKSIYEWLLGGIALTSWIMLFTFSFTGNSRLSNIFSTLFIFITYGFTLVFIGDLRKVAVSKSVFLLAVSSLVCLVISSVGPFGLAYLFSTKSLNAVLYKDALYTYLHFQYNGFFTLAAFALLLQKLDSKISSQAKKNFHRFSLLLVISVIPSQFLTYLWQGSNNRLFLFMAIAGSVTLLMTFVWFIISVLSISKMLSSINPLLKWLGVISMSAFTLKIFLQSFTIFPAVGNAVFGDRPVIIGFLHLVFLAFVSIFLVANFSEREFLNLKNRFTRVALIVFVLAVIFNEATLMAQGLGAMLIKGSEIYLWLLWIASIWLLCGALMILAARRKFTSISSQE